MMMKIKQHNSMLWIYTLPLMLALLSLGCGLAGVLKKAETQAIPTRTPLPTFTPLPTTAPFINVVVEEAAQVEPTATATQAVAETPAPTATPDNTVRITTLQNMNVREGPGTGYPVLGSAPAGTITKVTGRNADGSWVQVERPSGAGSGWIYTSLTDVVGDVSSMPVIDVPPPPPPVAVAPTSPPEPPPAEQAPAPPPEPQYQFTPTGWHASANAAIVHFKGRMKDEGGNLVNGYSVLVDNWSWSVVSHPSGPSHHYPQKGPGEWDVVIPATDIGNGVGWWWLTVVRYECPDFMARFDAQCKQFTRLSEDIKIMVNWPDETIINADWICHWDCDKGVYSTLYTGPGTG
jgi:uncharacterized protein YraI